MGVLDGLGSILDNAIGSTQMLGVNSTWTIVSENTSWNCSTGEYDIQDDATTDMTVFIPTEYNQNEIDGSRIAAGDYKLNVAGNKWDDLDHAVWGYAPKVDMVVQIKSNGFAFTNDSLELEYKRFTVKNVKPNTTGDKVATWECQLRAV